MSERNPGGTTTDHCAFCGKPEVKVQELVKGPDDATICDECLQLCTEIIAGERARPTQPSKPASGSEEGPAQGGRVSSFYCSFCGREHAEAERLIAGPRFVFICNVCVEEFSGTVAGGEPAV